MAAKKLLVKNTTTGKTEQYTTISTSAGTASEGNVPCLDANGLLNANMIPVTPSIHTFTAAAEVIIAAGKFININNSTGTPLIQLADCTDDTKPANGYCLIGGTATESVVATLEGQNNKIPIGTLAATDIGKRVFLSTSGGVTLTPPATAGNLLQCLGTLLVVGATYATVDFEFDDGVVM